MKRTYQPSKLRGKGLTDLEPECLLPAAEPLLTTEEEKAEKFYLLKMKIPALVGKKTLITSSKIQTLPSRLDPS